MNDLIEEIQNLSPEERVTGAAVIVVIVFLARKKRTAPRSNDPLDYPLMQWTQGCFLTVRHLLANILILGATGSGKTSGSGKHLMRAIVRYPGSGGLILAAKPEDADDVRVIFRAAGRGDDLLVVNDDAELRCNFIDYVRSMGGDAREITKAIITIAETLRSSDTKGGGEMGDFWDRENARLLGHAVLVVLLAKGNVSAPDLQRFIMTALQNPQQVSSEQWQRCFHDQCMRAAFDAPKTRIQQHDFELATDFFFREWPSMADKTRSSILTGVMGILFSMNSGLSREICSTTTNVSPDEMLRGRWVMVNLPPSKYGDTGSFINSGWKYLTQKMILGRKAAGFDAPIVIWCDEFQSLVNSADSHFLAQCRSHRGCQIMLSQSIHSLMGALKGDTGRHHAIALMSNTQHKVFHAIGDHETAEFASNLLGREERTKIGGSIAPAQDMWEEMFGPPKITTSFSEQWEPVVEPGVFMNGLRTGGPQNNYQVDAICIKTGDPFPGGGNWRFCTFDQRG
ncbi:MAG TPA: TraM recognition domain-containing protein [Pirellulales bacterium]|nr:TraM recognition domain-containing protein [Pirellulales bacterium]